MKLAQLFEVKKQFTTAEFVKRVTKLVKDSGSMTKGGHFQKPVYLNEGEYLSALMVGKDFSEKETSAAFYAKDTLQKIGNAMILLQDESKYHKFDILVEHIPKDCQEFFKEIITANDYAVKALKTKEFFDICVKVKYYRSEVDQILGELGLEMF